MNEHNENRQSLVHFVYAQQGEATARQLSGRFRDVRGPDGFVINGAQTVAQAIKEMADQNPYVTNKFGKISVVNPDEIIK